MPVPNAAEQLSLLQQSMLQMQQASMGSDESGLISGPIKRKRREKREAEAQQQLSAQQRAVNEQQAQNLLSQQGLDLSPEEQSIFMQGLSDPGIRDATLAELDQRQAAQSPASILQHKRMVQEYEIGTENLTQERIETSMAQMAQTRALGGIPDPQMVINTAQDLQKSRETQLSPYLNALDSYNELMSLNQDDPTGARSFALMFKFVKSMDNSAVRDGERAMISSAGGPLGELINKINLYGQKGFFSPQEWQNLVDAATDMAKDQFATAERINQNHDAMAGRYAKEFMMPALTDLTRSTRFDPNQQFNSGAAPTTQTGTTPPLTDSSGKRYEVVD